MAAASLLWHATTDFDPWFWSMWGRDLARLQLDTSMVVAWKPLPVLFTSVASLLRLDAPVAWIVIARAGGLLAVVVAFRLGRQLAGTWAGSLAVAALLLSSAVDARFLRLTIQGSVEPLVAAACLLAFERHLARREGTAFALLVVASLARPEAWVLLGLYGLWLWRARPELRWRLAAGALTVPVLWFGGDWLGSGDPLTGATRAQIVDVGERVRQVEYYVSRAVSIPGWIAASIGVALAVHRRDLVQLVLAGAALLWLGVVAGMTLVFGYAAIGRFMLPASAALGVVGAVGVVRLLRMVPSPPLRAGAAVAAVAATIPFAVPLVNAAADGVRLTTERAALSEDLDAVIARLGGPTAVRACGAVAIASGGIYGYLWPALAWKLDLPVTRVERPLQSPNGLAFLPTDGSAARQLGEHAGEARVVAESTHWAAWAVRCDGPDIELDADSG